MVKALFETYVVTEGVDRPSLDESRLPLDSVSFGFRMNLEMPEERVAQTKASLKELVSLRNDLVHHFIERFDMWTVEGCLAASQHLIDSYARIDERFEALRE